MENDIIDCQVWMVKEDEVTAGFYSTVQTFESFLSQFTFHVHDLESFYQRHKESWSDCNQEEVRIILKSGESWNIIYSFEKLKAKFHHYHNAIFNSHGKLPG